MAVFLAVSTDDGASWRPPVRVDSGPGRSRVFPAIAAGAPGKVAVAYYEADRAGYPSRVVDGVWNVTVAWTGDALAEAPTFERGTLSTTPARVGPICPDGTTCRGNRELLDYFSLKRLPDGRAAAAWTSTNDVEGRVVNVFGVTSAPILG